MVIAVKLLIPSVSRSIVRKLILIKFIRTTVHVCVLFTLQQNICYVYE